MAGRPNAQASETTPRLKGPRQAGASGHNKNGETGASPLLTEPKHSPANQTETLAKMMAKVYSAIDSINTRARISAN